MANTSVLASAPRSRTSDVVALMKPRVMALAVFTALVAFMVAPGKLDPLHATLAMLAIAAGAGAAGMLNMWRDADIDALMSRTAVRHFELSRPSLHDIFVRIARPEPEAPTDA